MAVDYNDVEDDNGDDEDDNGDGDLGNITF